MLRNILVPLAIIVVSISTIGAAQGQQDDTGAGLLFDQGKKLFDEGNYEEACPKLAASFKARPLAGTRGLEALCWEKLDKLGSAWAAWRDVLGMSRKSGDEDRVRVAEQHLADLDGKVARLVIAVQRDHVIEGMKVTRDGVQVASELWGVAVPIDRGAHTISVEAPGYESWSTTVEIENGHQRTVDVPVLAGASNKEGVTPAPAGGGAPARNGGTRKWIGISTVGVGVVAVGLGGYFGLQASGNWDDAQSLGCDDDAVCPTQAGANLIDDAHSNATLSNVFIGTGAVVVGVGLYVWLTAPSGGTDESAPSGTAWFTPSVGPDHIGVAVSGGF